jgi:tripartite-type tricarboxylate transporter receptor subunit TctC
MKEAMTRRCAIVAIATLFAGVRSLYGADLGYPMHPVHIIVPYLPGSGADLVSRTLAQKLSEAWGKSIVADNRPGGATNIGADLVARAAPDGYTLLLATVANAVNMTLYSRLSYDIIKDFAPISLLTIIPNLLVLHPSVPAKSVKELIALATARPGQLTYASAGIASANHLAGELFKTMAGVDIVHVPYKGGGAAVIDLLAGNVTMFFSSMPSSLPHVKTGKLRALAVTSAKRSHAVPDLPTIAESGLAGYEQVGWNGLLAPAATPKGIVAKLHTEIVRILDLTEVREQLAAQGAEVVASTPAELAAFIKAAVSTYGTLVKKANIKVD